MKLSALESAGQGHVVLPQIGGGCCLRAVAQVVRSQGWRSAVLPLPQTDLFLWIIQSKNTQQQVSTVTTESKRGCSGRGRTRPVRQQPHTHTHTHIYPRLAFLGHTTYGERASLPGTPYENAPHHDHNHRLPSWGRGTATAALGSPCSRRGRRLLCC